MIYIVSGFMRSLTSGTMKALHHGGMDAVRSKARDTRMAERWDDKTYSVNDEYYELDRDDYRSPDFPAPYEGKLVKCLLPGALRLPAGHDYSIVVMRRPAREIDTSLFAAFGNANMDTADPQRFSDTMDRYQDILADRRSVKSLHVIWARALIADPVKELSKLNWPFDPVKAAEIIDPAKLRHAA